MNIIVIQVVVCSIGFSPQAYVKAIHGGAELKFRGSDRLIKSSDEHKATVHLHVHSIAFVLHTMKE